MKTLMYSLLLAISLLAFQSCDKEEQETPAIAIGDFHEGGVVFYIDDTGEHGLASAIYDLGFDKEWGCPSLIKFGAKGLEIGTGAQNTLDIITACNETNIAASLCVQLVHNGYEDWFLPSKDELDALYQQQTIVNETALENNGESFSNGGRYWSSSHEFDDTVWIEYFNTGEQSGTKKDTKHYVRAIRSF